MLLFTLPSVRAVGITASAAIDVAVGCASVLQVILMVVL